MLTHPLLGLPRLAKQVLALCVDMSLCLLALWFALYLRLGEWVSLSGEYEFAALMSILLAIPIFISLGLYRAVFRYADWAALTAVLIAVAVYGVAYSAIFTAYGVSLVPRTIGILQPILLLVSVGASRAFARYWLGGEHRGAFWRRRGTRERVLIYGAGSAGRQLAGALASSAVIRSVGFIDDDRGLRGSVISGLKVYAPADLAELVERHYVQEVFLAIPSASRKRRLEIVEILRSVSVGVRTLPGLMDLASGRVQVADLRPLDIEDLLGREPVSPDNKLLEKNTKGKVVLVTGAGGSIGSELCRQILSQAPKTLLLIDVAEYSLYAIDSELNILAHSMNVATKIVPLLASVKDEPRMAAIMNAWRPSIVYHAAAYKHVPVVEHNVIDGVANNVFGTKVAAKIAIEYGVEDFVLISTDKAVRPTNVMGASKRLAEMTLQALANEVSGTRFSMVRFGNVLGSSGSVVPLFRSQIMNGGPITVTDPRMTRYFMTIPEAAQLVIQAGALAKGGEVFVLDMGEPVQIVDLAVQMIELSGLKVRNEANPDGDIEIVFSGLRPGEKLYEELLIGDNPVQTLHKRIWMANEMFIELRDLESRLQSMEQALGLHDAKAVLTMLRSIVLEYSPNGGLVDWVSAISNDGSSGAHTGLSKREQIAD